MSSKASEILGVSSKRPPSSVRRHLLSRDGDSVFSSFGSRRPSNLGEGSTAPGSSSIPPPSISSRRRDRSGHSASKNSVESIPLSVRFTQKHLAPADSQASLRSATPQQYPAPPSVSSSRAAPSAWRGLGSRADGSNTPMSSRPSQDSMSTMQSQSTRETAPRSKTLLRSALSRFTLRPSKSRSTLASSQATSAVSTARPSAATTRQTTATTTRQGTPRATSPTGLGIDAGPAPTYAPQPSSAQSPSAKPKRRMNSRMPTEVDRPSSRNWYDGLDDEDFDDARQSPYIGAPPPRSSSIAKTTAAKPARHLSRPLLSPTMESNDGDSQRHRPLAIEVIPTSDGRVSRATVVSNEVARKRRSKPPELAPHDYSILNLSDSEDEQIRSMQSTKATVQRYINGQQGVSNEATSRPSKRDTAVLRAAPDRSGKSRKSTPRVLSVLKVDDYRAEPSPSLPSLVGSGSSRQTSFVSSKSQSRLVPLEPVTGNNPLPFSRAKIDAPDQLDFDSSKFSDPSKLAGSESEDEFLTASARQYQDADPLSPIGHVMAALSPEEAAWLAHMRRNRAETLQKLNPTVPKQKTPSLARVSVRDFEGENQQRSVAQASKLYQSSELDLADDSEAARLPLQPILDNNEHEQATPTPDTPETMTLAESTRPAETDDTYPVQDSTEAPASVESNAEAEVANVQHNSPGEATRDNQGQGQGQSQAQSPAEPQEPFVITNDSPRTTQRPVSPAAEPLRGLSNLEKLLQSEDFDSSQPQTPIQENMARPRKANLSYSEVRSRFERISSGKSSLPIPKRVASKGLSNSTLVEERPQSPRVPAASLSRLRHYQSSVEATDEEAGTLHHGPPTPLLTSFPQPPGSHDTLPDDMPAISPSVSHDSQQNRRDEGARDVLEAWQALGGG